MYPGQLWETPFQNKFTVSKYTCTCEERGSIRMPWGAAECKTVSVGALLTSGGRDKTAIHAKFFFQKDSSAYDSEIICE